MFEQDCTSPHHTARYGTVLYYTTLHLTALHLHLHCTVLHCSDSESEGLCALTRFYRVGDSIRANVTQYLLPILLTRHLFGEIYTGGDGPFQHLGSKSSNSVTDTVMGARCDVRYILCVDGCVGMWCAGGIPYSCSTRAAALTASITKHSYKTVRTIPISCILLLDLIR